MILRLFPLLALVLPVAGASDTPAPGLDLSADAPRVAVAPRPPGRGFLELPDLEYRFALLPRCPAGWSAAQLSLGVADTRTTLAPGPAPAELVAALTVPAAQLAPLPLSGFCAADAGDPGGEELSIDAALSAHASLLCIGESDEQQRLFASLPLGLVLVCDRGDTAATGG